MEGERDFKVLIGAAEKQFRRLVSVGNDDRLVAAVGVVVAVEKDVQQRLTVFPECGRAGARDFCSVSCRESLASVLDGIEKIWRETIYE